MVDAMPVMDKKRELPSDVQYYEICPDGSVVESTFPGRVDVYITELDVKYFTDREVMLYLLSHYGRYVGVMRDISYGVTSRVCNTPLMLLGYVKRKNLK